VPTYDRSDLILRAINTLRRTLTEEMVIVSVVILIFLWHIPSAIIPILTIPIAIILSFIPMDLMHVTANIMSLGGIAVAIGAMVDAAIVVVEQTHKKLEHWQAAGRKGDYREVVISAVKEVGGPSFFALLVIAVSFIPVFALEAQEGRLFKPLALTKNFSMAIAAALAITLVPAILLLFTRPNPFTFRPRWLCRVGNVVLVGTIHSEENHPISRPLMRLYQPVVEFVLRWPVLIITTAVLTVLATVPVFQRLGSEFMPPLNEGTILHMPTALPGISPTEAQRVLQVEGKALMQFPEVERVFGKIGRAQTPTDPAPLNMVETVITLKPEEEWRPGVTWDSLLTEMDQRLRLPGMPNIWWMPIQTRTEMLATGIRSVLGIKVLGPNLHGIEQIGQQIETVLGPLRGTRSAYYDRTLGGYYLDFHIKRDEAARYGLTVGEVEDIIETAIGGKNIAQTVEGRERYPINVRYARELRDDVEMLKRVLVPTPSGAKIPIVQLAELRFAQGPPMIRDELGQLVGFVFIDVVGRDLGGYVEEAKRTVAERVPLPPGYTLLWAGQFEYQVRAKETLKVAVPFTLLLIFLLLYLNTKSVTKTLIILVAVPFSAVGAIWLLYLLDYNMSVAVWVGLIALMGVDAETGMFMLLYLDLAYQDRQEQGQMRSWDDLAQAVITGAVQRLRPKVMTVGVMFLGLVPIMWSHGTGADVMKRIAAPMIGGIFTSFLLELVVYPAIFALWKWHAEVKPSLQATQVAT
jgi:Cu(I)/Ag(I) efflux system membrane protein CusA/SilA